MTSLEAGRCARHRLPVRASGLAGRRSILAAALRRLDRQWVAHPGRDEPGPLRSAAVADRGWLIV